MQTELASLEAAQAEEILEIVQKYNQQKLPVYARRQKEIEQVCFVFCLLKLLHRMGKKRAYLSA